MITTIIGVNLENREETSVKFQKILTKFGCEIKTRIGLHPSVGCVCLNRGIVLLEVSGEAEDLCAELQKYWDVQTMSFN